MRWSLATRAVVSATTLVMGALSACSAPNDAAELTVGQAQQAVTAVLDDQVMRVVGKQLFDSNGAPFLTRGVEGWFEPSAQAHINTFVDGIASQGFNAARMQLVTADLAKIEALIKRFHSNNMVVYVVDANMPLDPGVEWFGLPEVQTMIQRNRRNLVVDASIEEQGNCDSSADEASWLATQKATITKFRNWGYNEPLTIGTMNEGRCLRALLDHGQELVDYDPLHSLILNAQMYWGSNYGSGFSWQGANGFSEGNTGIKEATAEVAAKPFLIQFGLDARDSGGNDAQGEWATIPYSLLMTEAQNKGIGTMWWEWKNIQNDNLNSLVNDELDATSLTPLGDIVINTHAKSIKKTSKTLWPCGIIPAKLLPGQSVTSCDGHWALRVRANPTDANAVLKYDSRLAGRVVFGAEDTLPAEPNHSFMYLSMQGDGNLVAYYKKNGVTTPTWASNTFGTDFYAKMTNTGAVKVYSADGVDQWHSRDLFKPAAACGRLNAVEMIGGSEVSGAPTVLSCNGLFGFALISSGTPSAADAFYGSPTWKGNSSAGSAGTLVVGAVSNGQFTRTRAITIPRAAGRSPAVAAFMQGDGNLVVRDNLGNPGGDALWASDTYGNDGAYIDVGNDGRVRVMSASGTAIKTLLNPP